MGKTVTKNRKAFHDYDFEEFYEAGLQLEGTEVKALREGRAHLKDSYVIVRGEELFLIGAYIGPYGNAPSDRQHNPERTRKLLLKKREIKELIGKLSRQGYSLIPVQIYFNNRGWAKAQLGLGKGLKKHDKRRKKKERDVKRRLQQNYDAQIR
ncbi:MAG: SsrA-binding protein SmpB [bacterium]